MAEESKQVTTEPQQITKEPQGEATQVQRVMKEPQSEPKTVKQWLSHQAFWQVHLPAPK